MLLGDNNNKYINQSDMNMMIGNSSQSLRLCYKRYKAGLINLEDIPKNVRELMARYYGVDIRGTHNVK